LHSARHPHSAQRAPDGPPIHCERHCPENTALYRLVQQHAASFIALTEASTGNELPQFIKDQFHAFVECGILANGYLTLRDALCRFSLSYLSPTPAGTTSRPG
jgi:hypothetical protein